MSTRRNKRRRVEPEEEEAEGDDVIDISSSPPPETAKSVANTEAPPEPDEEALAREREIWDAFREEHYEVLEQLPLSLHRAFTLIKELDQQAQGHGGTPREAAPLGYRLLPHARGRSAALPKSLKKITETSTSTREILVGIAQTAEEVSRASNEKEYLAQHVYDLAGRPKAVSSPPAEPQDDYVPRDHAGRALSADRSRPEVGVYEEEEEEEEHAEGARPEEEEEPEEGHEPSPEAEEEGTSSSRRTERRSSTSSGGRPPAAAADEEAAVPDRRGRKRRKPARYRDNEPSVERTVSTSVKKPTANRGGRKSFTLKIPISAPPWWKSTSRTTTSGGASATRFPMARWLLATMSNVLVNGYVVVPSPIFHLPCVGLSHVDPNEQWYCRDCAKTHKKRKGKRRASAR
ncbi:uncharacterized protein BXZ73DRAFT_73164 [Epithele typhae]|uniref:uncharacterized protein n=1 Tax=Epithele typhae TaxID=378194 RepID=UPI002008D331|nr:uncharacterized protein BXZ73DRAFT_73164 [Epithele typhae]KAH9946392.1 hypothetical protein BXZ73DRAFT_73164 [Epithele typhae]